MKNSNFIEAQWSDAKLKASKVMRKIESLYMFYVLNFIITRRSNALG